MSDVNANIGINFDATQALAELRRLQEGLSKFNQTLTQGNVAAANAQKGLTAQLTQSINATGKFVASQKEVATSTASFTNALEKNQLGLRDYFRYSAAAATMNTKSLGSMFQNEKDVLNRAMKDRVKILQTQYVQLTNANGDLVKVLQVVPKHLQMVNGQYTDFATKTQMAAQRQQFLNQLLQQGSTQLLNFGKNTQWAGRQLMVGLTIPLTMLGGFASKAFQEMEMATVSFQKVYGDMVTTVGETDAAVAGVRRLALEFTKYGIAAKDTMALAAKAASAGYMGAALTAQITQSTRLAVLGQVDQQTALQTTISLQNAFGISAEQLAGKINFLNAVENQTVLSIEDLTIAIPKAAPVVKQLGGSVEDLAFFLTAMKEGGVDAAQGANALKSGLASMINPTKKASDFLANLGINITGIVENNKGDLKGTIVGFARALDTLDPLNRARAIEQLFGKFQFARMSTLFQNVSKDSSQAMRVFGLASKSAEELAILAERELGQTQNAVTNKWKKTVEQLKIQLMPLGKAFLQAATPIANFVSKMLEKFNNLSDGTKKFVMTTIAVLGGIAPVVLMTVGLVANGAANLIKFFAMLRGGMAKLNGQNDVLGGGFNYLTQAETENLAQSHALHTTHKQLIDTFNVEKTSLFSLGDAYAATASQARRLAESSPGLFNTVPGAKGAVSKLPKFATGTTSVPGTGDKDTTITALTPGEAVIPKKTAQSNPELMSALVSGNIQKFGTGTTGSQSSNQSGFNIPGNWSADAKKFILQQEQSINSQTEAATTRILDFAKAKGHDTENATKQMVESWRQELLKDFHSALGDISKGVGSKMETIGHDAIKGKFKDQKVGTSGSLYEYTSKNGGQQFKPQFSHVGDADFASVDEALSMNLNERAKKQLEIYKKHFEDQGKVVPKVRVADAFGFDMVGHVNRAMVGKDGDTPEKIKARQDAYKANSKYGGKSVVDNFNSDFAATGASKWKKMTDMAGGDFDKLQGEIKIYDDALLARTRQWAKANPDGIFTDDVFAQLENEVRAQVKTLIPEFNKVIQTAKDTVTAIRVQPQSAKDLSQINTKMEAAGAGTIGDRVSNAKVLNDEARKRSEIMGRKTGSAAIDGINSSDGIDAKSPSKKAKKSGENVGDGFVIGMKNSESKVRSQAKKLGDSSVDAINKAKYDELKNDPTLRQNQKAIDRHFRNKFGTNQTQGQETITTSSEMSITASMTEKRKEQEKAINDQNKSDILLAEKTDELHQTTSDIADSANKQKEQAFTTAELAAAEAKSRGEITLTSQEILAKQEQIVIEEQKRLEQLRNLNNQNASATVGGPSQTERLDADIAVDSDGNPIVDPETGVALNKKQAKKLQVSQKRTERRQAVGKYSGKAAGALGTAAMAAGMLGAPPAVTGALGSASMVASFAPMLAGMTGPQGVVVGLAALAIGAKLLNDRLHSAASAAAQLVRSTSGTTDLLKKISEQTGTVGASEIMQKRRAEGDYQLSTRKGTTASATYLSGAAGKAMTDAFKQNAVKNGTDIAARDFAAQLASAISDGTIAPDLGQHIAEQLGINLKNNMYSVMVSGELRRLIGPGGEDILNNPLSTRIRIAEASSARTQGYLNQMNSKDRSEVGSNSKLSMFATLGAIGAASGSDKAAMFGASSAISIETAQSQADSMAMYYETQLKSLEAEKAATTNKAKQIELQTKITNMQDAQIAGMKTMNNLVAAQLQMQTNNFNTIIKNGGLKNGLAGSFWGNDAARRESAASDALKNDVTAKYKDTASSASAQRVMNIGAKADQDMSFGTIKDKNYGETDAERVARKIAGRTFEAKLNLIMASGQMSPESIEGMTKIFSGNLQRMDVALDIGIRMHGGAKMQQLAGMLTNVKKSVAQDLIVKIARKNPADFEKTMKALTLLQRSDGMEVDMSAYLKVNGEAKLAALSAKLDKLDKMKDPITKDVAIQYGKDNNVDMTGVIDNWDYYAKMPDNVRKEALETHTVLFETMTHFNSEAERTAWANIQAEKAALLAGDKGKSDGKYEKTYKTTFETLTKGALNDPTQASKNANTGVVAVYGTIDTINANQAALDKLNKTAGTKPPDPYVDILKRLKEVRLASINAAGGINALRKALSTKAKGGIGDQFNGIVQQMMKKGVQQQYIDWITNMDPKEQAKWMKTATTKITSGKNKGRIIDPFNSKKLLEKGAKVGDVVLSANAKDMEKGYNLAIAGEFNISQLKILRNFNEQATVAAKLGKMGYSNSQIQAVLSDEAFTTLIATKGIDDAQLKINLGLVKEADLRTKINGLIKTGSDAMDEAKNNAKIPDVVKFFSTNPKLPKLTPDALKSLIADPASLDAAIAAMDRYGQGADGAAEDLQKIIEGLNQVKENSNIKIAIEFATSSISSQANKQFEAAKTIMAARTNAYSHMTLNELRGAQTADTSTIGGKAPWAVGEAGYQSAIAKDGALMGNAPDAATMGKSLIGIQRERASIASKVASSNAAINKLQADMAAAQNKLSADLAANSKKFDDLIKVDQKSIDEKQAEIKKKWEDPAKNLQTESSKISNDLTVMAHQADAISKKYDEQVTALQEVQKINENIVKQQQMQLGLADALTSGDISAAAKAAQEMRASNASQYSSTQMDALNQGKTNAIDALRNGSGQSKLDLEERQYQIGQELYALETDPKRLELQTQIEALQAKITKNQKDQQDAAEAIQTAYDASQATAIASLATQNSIAADLAAQDASLASQEVTAQLIVDAVAAIDDSSGHTLTDWQDIVDKLPDAQTLAEAFALALDGAASSAAAQAGSWTSILASINAIPLSKTTELIVNEIHRITTEFVGGYSNNGNVPPTPTPIPTPTPAPIACVAPLIPGPNGTCVKPVKPIGDYGWDDSRGWVHGGVSTVNDYSGDDLIAKNAAAAARAKADAEAAALAAAAETGHKGTFAEGLSLNNAWLRYMDINAQKGILKGMGYWAQGGFISKGTDTVPAMLTPGEFVMSKYAVDSHGVDKMKAINNGDSVGDSVYNYSISVNVKSDANANDIAKTVMNQIKEIDSQRMRGVRL